MTADLEPCRARGNFKAAWPIRLLLAWIAMLLSPGMWTSDAGRLGLAEEFDAQAAAPVGLPGSLTGRAGYIAFETFGRDDSIAHAELMPYAEVDQHTLFGDARVFMTNDCDFGGNVGFGYRYRLPEGNRFVGASLWYDLDDTTGEMFHQLAVGLESCGSLWDVRTNFYFPIGDFEKDYHLAVRDQHFAGNQVVYTSARSFGEALTGFDLELSLPLPTGLARTHNITITPGTYMFFGDAAPDIYGYKVRAEGNVTSNLAMQVEMTSDDTFGTNVTVGIEFVLPGGSRLEDPSDTGSKIRTDQFVHRNYNIIVSKQVDLQRGVTAVNPATGRPYTVRHVSSTAGGAGLGTVENPYHTIAEAQAAGGDLIFVHGGSVLSDPLVMQAGEQILGEGVDYYIDYGRFGSSLLPAVNASAARPTLLGVSGDAVTLASDSTLSGFVLDSPTGHGIAGDSIGNIAVRNVDVRNAGLDGLYLRNVSGENNFRHLTISGAGAAGVQIDGGSGGFNFAHTSIRNAAAAGVDVRNHSGSFAFEDLAVIAEGGGPAVRVADSTSDGAFESLDIRTNGATGLFVRNAGELSIESGRINAVNGTAVDIENATVNARLTRVASSGAPVGIRIVDHQGKFMVMGDSSYGSGGLIRDAATGILLVNAGTVGFQYVDLDGNGVGVDASNIERLALSFARVTGSTSFGLDALNAKVVEITDSAFAANGGAATNSIRFRSDAQGDYAFYVSRSTITDASAAAIAIATAGSGDDSTLTLQIDDTEITTNRLGAAGVLINWKGSMVASILQNTFTGTAGLNTGVDVTTTSTTELAKIALLENTFAFEGGDDVGMRFVTSGPATISVESNTIDFDGAGGAGVYFALAKSADVYLCKNTITDNASGGTGILFSSIAGPSSVTLQANTINLLSKTSIIDRGIIFTSITDTIIFKNPTNNVVTGATTPFYAPMGSILGHAYVNNVTVP